MLSSFGVGETGSGFSVAASEASYFKKLSQNAGYLDVTWPRRSFLLRSAIVVNNKSDMGLSYILIQCVIIDK